MTTPTSGRTASSGARASAVTVAFDEFHGHSRAVARLSWHGETLVGRGLSRLDVGDEIEHPIGETLALARALSALARQLFTDAARDIEIASAARTA